MLRYKAPIWIKDKHSGSENNIFTSVNNIIRSGSYVLSKNIYDGSGSEDPNAPRPKNEEYHSFVGSHYFLEHRTLYQNYNESNIPETETWFSQVAYSYFNPCLGVRCRSGIGSGVSESKWTDWEFTVMSGIQKDVIYATLNDVKYVLQFKKHRNSDIVSLYISISQDTVGIVSEHIPYGRTKFNFDKVLHPMFIPKIGRTIPLTVCSNTSDGYGVTACTLQIESDGEIWVYNEYNENNNYKTYSFIASGFECFYSLDY